MPDNLHSSAINTEINNNEKVIKDNYDFSIDKTDTIFILTRNNSTYIKDYVFLAAKMVVLEELNYVNLNNMSMILNGLGIKKLAIFSIDNELNSVNVIKKNNGCAITLMELNPKQLVNILTSDVNFLEYNKYSLYILRNGTYLDIKVLFSSINGCNVCLGRGGSQKSHILSPLDLRLATYMLAMFSLDYNLIKNQNVFDTIEKDRYLTYKGDPYVFVSTK